MKGCLICNAKNHSFYVSSENVYICPKHRELLKKDNESEANKYKKNRFIIDGKVAYMSIYDYQYREKPYRAIVDPDDIPILQEIRWYEDKHGYIVTSVIRNGKNLRVRMADFIMYARYGITSPIYHVNCNPYDLRKCNIRIKKDQRWMKSSIRHID